MSKGRIMIVEDERIVALDLEVRLQSLGFEVVGCFGRGEDAIEHAQRLAPELALMDIRLAGAMDGVEAAGILRNFGIPVVYLTAYTDEATVERLKPTEPLGYVLKPFDERTLLATVETALFRQRAERGRAEAENARRRAEARYFATLDNSPDAIISVDRAGRIVVFNRAAERMFGYSAAEGLNLPLTALLPLEHRERHVDSVEQFRTEHGGARPMARLPSCGEATVHPLATGLRRDGTVFPIEVSISMFEDDEPVITAVIRDVSERMALEDKLRRAQRVEALGMLAASVIHDVNNLLTIIKHGADLVRHDPRPANESPYLETIGDAVARGAALTRQLLLYASRAPGRREPAAVDETLRQLQRILEHVAPESVRVELSLEAGDARVGLDHHRLEQVILNCVANARDAMPGGGQISVRTRSEGSPDGRTAIITISDTGTGIPPEILAHVFEPFFTTKDGSRGTGLGLWTVRDVIEGASGTIELDSGIGRGTTVTIRLPCATAPVSERTPTEKRPAPADVRGAQVLIVEDEELLRHVLARSLEVGGFRVHTAAGAGEALALLETGAVSFDVLVVDLGLPIMSGRELAERMRRFLPRLRVVLISGYADQLEDDIDQTDGLAVLAKPFSGDELIAEIGRLLRPSLASLMGQP